MKYYDNSRISPFKNCPRKYYFRHIRHWTPIMVDEPLAFGAAWHKALDVIWRGGSVSEPYTAFLQQFEKDGYKSDPFVLPDSVRNLATAHSMLEKYVEARKDVLKQIKLIASEQPFAVPLDESGKLYYVGRMDKVFELRNRIYVDEHKTTTRYKKDGPFQAGFLKSFNPNAQIDGFKRLARLWKLAQYGFFGQG